MTNIGNKNHFKDPLFDPSYSWDEVDPEDLSDLSLHPVARAKWYLHTLQPDERAKPGGTIIGVLLDYIAENKL